MRDSPPPPLPLDSDTAAEEVCVYKEDGCRPRWEREGYRVTEMSVADRTEDGIYTDDTRMASAPSSPHQSPHPSPISPPLTNLPSTITSDHIQSKLNSEALLVYCTLIKSHDFVADHMT